MDKFIGKFSKYAALALLMAAPFGSAWAGSVFLTGHDIFLHGGQSGYDITVLDYLRSESGEARATYTTGFLTNGGVTNPTGRFTAAGYPAPDVRAPTAASIPDFAAFLSGIDALVIPWRIDIGAAGSAFINSFATEIQTFFNAGGDIFATSNRCVDLGCPTNDPDFYDFLPPGATAPGGGLPGDPASGFVLTPAGLGIGLTLAMADGRPTHNTFVGFDSDFTVMETHPASSGNPVISIGLIGGTIGTDDITTDDTTTIPEPSTLALLGLALLAGFKGRRSAV